MSGPKCKIWWDTNVQSYHVSTPYNPEFVAALKQLIPVSDRHFDFDAKIWVFTERFFGPVSRLAKTIWPNPGEIVIIDRVTTDRASQPTAVEKKPLSNLCQEFLEVLPFDAAQSAYKKAALLLHPDRGGDMEKMATLNALWNRLRKEIYKQ